MLIANWFKVKSQQTPRWLQRPPAHSSQARESSSMAADCHIISESLKSALKRPTTCDTLTPYGLSLGPRDPDVHLRDEYYGPTINWQHY